MRKEDETFTLENLDHEQRIYRLIEFMRLNELREELGWAEHTSDWDPILIIETDTEFIETASGYSEMELINYTKEITHYNFNEIQQLKVLVDKADGDDYEPREELIDIDKIKTITWDSQ
jgi:hypothetical protein